MAGSIRRRIRAAIDGSLHGGRHDRAIGLLAEMDPPRNILVLCFGNVCRSPFVEYRLRGLLHDRQLAVEVRSAGFIGAGRQPPGGAIRAADRQGIDTSDHRSQLVSQSLIEKADLLLLMEVEHGRRIVPRRLLDSKAVVVLGDLDPAPITNRNIIDPWGERAAVYDRVFDRLDRCVDVLMQTIRWPDTSAPVGLAEDGARTSR